jgi:hypothetical protein
LAFDLAFAFNRVRSSEKERPAGEALFFALPSVETPQLGPPQP